MTTANSRAADYPIEALFLERWSPRAFTGEAIPDADLRTIFEAARWAPSSYNSQPWRFLYAKRDTPAFTKFLGLLSEFNQSWAKNASMLIIVLSKEAFTPPGKTEAVASHSHSFDAGAAWGYLALQAWRSGYAAHAMTGFDIPRAAIELNAPDDCRVEAAIAIGRVGDKSILPEAAREREKPNSRNPQSDFVFEGGFPAS
ncbi:nitroreductase family protein [Methylocella tundrae]|jgi:nitroreductase|uniref:Nitroreductase n=1 Tax=Methylocella tundrae TaxID=227605 RepID=A0A4U8Z2D5_METTU|nr:nitroreductase family protein [Methylocella tundrae]WPP03416.1 nitroreductase family protein [Methylocella tundrae]VFU09476.1 Nitroreductase [Methylocella tundrae]